MRHAFAPAFIAALFLALLSMAAVTSAQAAMKQAAMKMEMSDTPAHFAPTKAAYSNGHAFLVRLLAVPKPIPFEKYFTVRFGVYDGHHPKHLLSNASLKLNAGMRHGLKHGFAHGMESSPKISDKGGVFTVSGMYFHMNGPWVLKMWVRDGAKHGIVYFKLPCCGH